MLLFINMILKEANHFSLSMNSMFSAFFVNLLSDMLLELPYRGKICLPMVPVLMQFQMTQHENSAKLS